MRQGAFPSEEGFGRGFHDVELSTDFWAPYKRVEDRDKSELTAHREYAYVMTPDGRLHSNRVVVEGVGGHSLADYKRKYFDVRKIVESREITPEGRVASNRRIVEYMAELNEEDSLRHHRAMGEEIGLTRDYMVSKEESRPRRGTEEEIENLTYNQYGWIQKREHRRLKNGDIVDEWTVTRVGGINFLVERPEKFRDPFPWGRKQQPEYLGHRSGAAEERYNNPFYAFGDLMES